MKKKICAISDIHGDLIDIPSCDILCISGDILPLKIQKDHEKSIDWLMNVFYPYLLNLDCKHVIMIWGNHDFIGQKFHDFGYTGEYQSELLFGKNSKVHILLDESIEIEKIKIYGTPWVPELSGWAFYGPSTYLNYKYNLIPEDIDILLTHCPPKFGTQGVVLQECWNYGRDFGSIELQNVIESKEFEKDLYIISGHIHSGNHEIETNGNIKYVNVSIKDEDYKITYQPKIIEI